MDKQMTRISSILEEWGKLRVQIEELFRERNPKNTLALMGKGISLFREFLFLVNEIPDSKVDKIPYHQFDFKPFNIEERFGFIMARPNLFHSFRQLSELFKEQEKQFGKKQIKKSSR